MGFSKAKRDIRRRSREIQKAFTLFRPNADWPMVVTPVVPYEHAWRLVWALRALRTDLSIGLPRQGTWAGRVTSRRLLCGHPWRADHQTNDATIQFLCVLGLKDKFTDLGLATQLHISRH